MKEGPQHTTHSNVHIMKSPVFDFLKQADLFASEKLQLFLPAADHRETPRGLRHHSSTPQGAAVVVYRHLTATKMVVWRQGKLGKKMEVFGRFYIASPLAVAADPPPTARHRGDSGPKGSVVATTATVDGGVDVNGGVVR
nr:hypothetical protein [Tanacetum cinerariifolium]